MQQHYQQHVNGERYKYQLFAVSNHFGTMSGGHYTATVRDPHRAKWMYFDDSRITDICAINDTTAENAKVKTQAAYSLFYVSYDGTAYRSQ
jgi:ubiquitin C-terminal hydrolase